ncbi:2-iminoacetate synthase ThiH [bacterium]|nr:2-iminoacetate synthase ThiH [bacterium]
MTSERIPKDLDPTPWLETARSADEADVRRALGCEMPDVREFGALLSPAASKLLEELAARAQALTRRHFGRTISLYAPLYLSNFCCGGCVYCGFASDRSLERRRMGAQEMEAELEALKKKGLEDVLLLTGERSPQANYPFLKECVAKAARRFHNVTVESFAMTQAEYAGLEQAGCTGATLYQETYDPGLYLELHRWGPKRNYESRLDAPARALAGGLRTVGLGALLGLADPLYDLIALYRHVRDLQRRFWQAGFSVSFPRICPQTGGYQPAHIVDERLLAQAILAFRICLPDVPLVLSTRETERFRNGMAGLGITRMSVESRTTVGGYHKAGAANEGQFEVQDQRDIAAFCGMLRSKGLEPVFKNWDAVFQATGA